MSGIVNYQNIEFGEIPRGILQSMATSYTVKNCYRIRATMVLDAAKGQSFIDIGKKLNISDLTVSKWVHRFYNNLDDIQKFIHDNQNDKHLILHVREIIEITLSDAPRSGRPQVYSETVRMAIVAICLRDPGEFGFEINYWQLKFIKLALKEIGINEDISLGGIYKILLSFDFKPWKIRYYLNSVEKGTEEYEEKVKAINSIYRFANAYTAILNENNEKIEDNFPEDPIIGKELSDAILGYVKEETKNEKSNNKDNESSKKPSNNSNHDSSLNVCAQGSTVECGLPAI